MTNDSAAVLEVGSQKVTCIIGQRGVNNTFIIKSIAECDYDGFSDRQFFDLSSLADAVKEVVSRTANNARTHLDKLYVSVPGEFSKVSIKEHTLAFKNKKRIRRRDTEDLYKSFSLSETSKYEITDISAIYYTLDDNRRVSDPTGVSSYKLGGLLCYMLGDRYYLKLMRNICKRAGTEDIEFISESLAEAKYLIPKEERTVKRAVVDVGYLTTNVFVALGGGVLYQKAFSDGGGYITAELMEKADIDFDVAETLKRKINLGFSTKLEGNYFITVNDEDYDVPLQKANFTVRFCLDRLAERIDNVLKQCPTDLKLTSPVGLTGGGISYMRGGPEYLASRLELPVTPIAPSIPYMNKAQDSALLSLLNEALERMAAENG